MCECKPIICTLSDGDRKARAVTWRDVMHQAVTQVEERPDGFVLTLDPGTLEFSELHRLVESERLCCAWMTLELDEGPVATLTITSESLGGKGVIKEMLGL